MGALKAGDLDRRVTLQKYTMVRDAGNEPVETWTDLRTVSASWRRASAREIMASAQLSATASDVFEIRWASDLSELDTKDRVVYNGKTYDITAVAEIERREGLRIDAVRSADGGDAA